MKRTLTIILSALVILGFAGTAFAAPNITYQRNIAPEATNTYDNGAPSDEWLHVYSQQVCVSGDCRTTWPTGTAYTATYPITITGTAIGSAFGTTTANIWSQLQTFSNASTTQISSTGNAYFATSAGSVGIASTSPDATLGLTGNFNADDSNGKYSWIGTPMTAAGAFLAPGADMFVVGTTTSITSRGALIVNNYTGPASASAVAQGINGIELLGSKATGSLTFTTTSGGSLRSRYLVNNLSAGYGVSQMSAMSAGAEVQGTLASSTDAADFNAELPVVNSGDLITNFYGLRVNGGAVTGTLTNNYGVKVESMVGGTNRWAFYQAGTADNNYFAGSTGIGTTSPWRSFAVNGTVGFTGLTTSASTQTAYLCLSSNNEVIQTSVGCLPSSERYKNSIAALYVPTGKNVAGGIAPQGTSKDALSTVMALSPVSFFYDKTGNPAFDNDPNRNGPQVGLIAEQVATIDPRLIAVDDQGQPQTVRYENLTAVLAGAIQQQEKRMDWQWGAIALLAAYALYNEVRLRRRK